MGRLFVVGIDLEILVCAEAKCLRGELSIPKIAAIADKNASILKTFFMQNHPFVNVSITNYVY